MDTYREPTTTSPSVSVPSPSDSAPSTQFESLPPLPEFMGVLVPTTSTYQELLLVDIETKIYMDGYSALMMQLAKAMKHLAKAQEKVTLSYHRLFSVTRNLHRINLIPKVTSTSVVSPKITMKLVSSNGRIALLQFAKIWHLMTSLNFAVNKPAKF